MSNQPPRQRLLTLFRPDYSVACGDPTAAPGRYRGDRPAPRFTWRRALQNMVWVYGFGLVFLIYAIVAIPDGDPSTAELVWRIVLVVLIALGYLGCAWVADCSLRTRWLYILGYIALLACSGTTWGWSLVGYGAYVAIMISTLVPWRQSRIAIVVWAGLLALTIPFGGGDTAIYISVISLGMGLATGAGMEAGQAQARLRLAEQRVSTLSIAAERERIGRDLHDILGHSLTAISIKSSLAGKLIGADPVAAKAQIEEVEAIARQALADVRATASGLTEVRLATELASARSVLLAAGVEAQVPSALPGLSDQVSELFGYVVREAVTNVVRHAEATLCTISVTPTQVRIADDGTGRAGGAGRAGHGLSGLTERVAAAGGTLEVDSRPGAGTVITARLAAAGNPSATVEASR